MFIRSTFTRIRPRFDSKSGMQTTLTIWMLENGLNRCSNLRSMKMPKKRYLIKFTTTFLAGKQIIKKEAFDF